jgi:hypothetical protein
MVKQRIHPNCKECGTRYRFQSDKKDDHDMHWWCPNCGTTEGCSPMDDPRLQDYGVFPK